jgi:phosphomannomutase/phosphoglucomutase
MLVFAMDILKKNKSLEKVSFVSEVKCSQVLYDEIERCGGRAVMWKTGHGFIKNKMKEENALMGGEMSGHIFFKDRYYGFDDAIYAGCRFIEIISQLRSESAKSSVSEFLNSFPKSITSKEIRFSCPNEHKYRIVKELQEEFSVLPNIFCNVIQQIIKIDGVRIVFADGFALIRASNTEPVFTMRFEASTKKNLDNYKQVMLSIVDKKVSECCKV